MAAQAIKNECGEKFYETNVNVVWSVVNRVAKSWENEFPLRLDCFGCMAKHRFLAPARWLGEVKAIRMDLLTARRSTIARYSWPLEIGIFEPKTNLSYSQDESKPNKRKEKNKNIRSRYLKKMTGKGQTPTYLPTYLPTSEEKKRLPEAAAFSSRGLGELSNPWPLWEPSTSKPKASERVRGTVDVSFSRQLLGLLGWVAAKWCLCICWDLWPCCFFLT